MGLIQIHTSVFMFTLEFLFTFPSVAHSITIAVPPAVAKMAVLCRPLAF